MKGKRTQRPAAKPQPESRQKPSARARAYIEIPGWAQLWLPAIALFLSALLLLGFGYGLFMRKVESLSLFLPTSMFFDQCMSAPGGFLAWVSLWLTQAFYHPWLGALVYASLLTGLAFVIKWAFGIRKGAFGYAIIVPAMALLAFIRLGYVIFSLKTPGYAFLLPLGLFAASLLFWGVRAIKIWWIRLLATLVAIIAGYWLAGFYGLLAGGLCMLAEVPPILKKDTLVGRIAIIALGIAALIAVPKLWFSFVGGDLMLERTYLYGLPRFAPDEKGLIAPYIISLVAFALFALFGHAKWLARRPLQSLVLGCAVLICVFFNRNDDPNFRLTLRLDRALQDGQWQEAVDQAIAFKHEPTRLNTVLADVATLRLGTAGDQIFALPFGSADYETARALRVMHDAGALPISYHLGYINYAYRWAMESKVEYGANVDQLKYFAKCALLNGEYPLARKYLRILSMTANHKDWAQKYMAYADDPQLIDADPEMGSIRRLMRQDDYFLYDNHTFENYLWRNIAAKQGGNAEQQELSIMAALISNDIDLAVSKMGEYYNLTGHMPQHMQEAVIMWSFVEDNGYCDQLGCSPATKQRFMQFLQMYNTYGENPPEQQLQAIKDAFGDTYWYYFFYTPNMLII